MKKKIFGEAIEEKMVLKKVNIYKFVPAAKKAILLELMKTKDQHKLYAMQYLDENDFKNMTSMTTWWDDWVIFLY